jgi:hypothetical protein
MDEVEGNRINRDGLLRQAEEEFAAGFRFPPVKPEGELVQIGVWALARPLAERAVSAAIACGSRDSC